MRIVFICLVFLVLFSNIAFALETSESRTKNHFIKKEQTEKTGRESAQLSILRLEKELLVSHNKELIDVIKWSLGFVAIFLMGFLGTVGFFNNKRISQDKEEVILLIEKSLLEIKASLEHDYSRIKENHDRLDIELSDKITEKSFSLVETVDEKITEAKNKIISLFSNVIDDREENIKRGISKIERSCVGLNSSVRDLFSDLKIHKIEGEIKYWELKEVEGIELKYWFEFIEFYAKKEGLEWAISDGLERMKYLLEKGADVGPEQKADCFKILDSMPATLEPLTKRIKEKIS